MIDVEKGALRAFKQNFFPALKRAMQINDRVSDERSQFFAGGEIAFLDLAIIDRFGAERLKDAVVVANFGLQFFREENRLH